MFFEIMQILKIEHHIYTKAQAMESAKAITSILSEIKSLESTLATVLMESVLKLIKLTDSNVFILIENEKMGRCFGGSKELCHNFRTGNLSASSDHVEMDVSMNVSSLSPKGQMENGVEPTDRPAARWVDTV